MPKSPKEPSEIFSDIVADYRDLFGDDLISIIMYGSATGSNYRPGKSDINFMIVLSEAGIKRLDRAFNTVKKWRKRKVAVPLFLTENYVETSLDVFPIEYLGFQRNHALIFGKDILKGLTVKPEFLRLQCEREIKGKLLLLRQTFLETSGKARGLRDTMTQSLPAFVAIFDSLLYLKGRDLPEDRREMIRNTCETFNMETNVFEKLLDIREEKLKPGDVEAARLFQAYLREIRKLAIMVDSLGGENG